MRVRRKLYYRGKFKSDIFTVLNPLIRPLLLAFARRRLPQTDGTIQMEGLQAAVEIIRDRWGVPHIYAASAHDLWFAQGFVHAQERFWQMEFNRRLVAGRLSEVLGKVAVQVDRWMRTLTMRRAAAKELEMLTPEFRSDLDAYVAGVNAYLEQGRLPVELALLGYQPEPWTGVDTLSWGKMMGWTMSVNWEMEILRARMIEQVGLELAEELEPCGLERYPTIIPEGLDLKKIGVSSLKRAQQAQPFTGPTDGIGSNNWVMSGHKTASGKPLVANDMHLALTAPAVWVENHLVGGGIHATGVSLPGIPGIISGHNGHVSWAITNGFPDVQDLFIENIRRETDGRVMVEYMDDWYEAEVFCEEIKVKNGKTVIEEVIITRHGPVINSLSPEASGEQPIAMRWTALDPETMLQDILYPTLQAKSCKEFHEALRHWSLPVLNFVYADTAGNIGFTHAGKIPIRRKGEGRIPVPGWVDDYEWDRYIPFDLLPHVENPPDGFIVTANNRVVEKYPYHLGGEMMRGDRAQRITELLRCCDKLDVRYAMRMQYDRKSPQGEVIARVLGALPLEGRKRAGELQPIVDLLKDWDAEMTPESPAAVIHQVTARTLVAILVAHKLGVSHEKAGKPKKPGKPDMALHYAGMGINPVLSPVSYYMERSMEWLELVLGNPESPWFDQGRGETREDIIYQALCESVDFLKTTLGPNPKKWAWGKLHKLRFNHNLGSAAPLREFLSRGPYPVGGDGTTIWATHSSLYDLNSDFLVGPPYRMIVDLGNLRNSWSLLAPGQSGHPASPHYDDQVKGWFEQGYHPMLFFREDIVLEGKERLVLHSPSS